MSEQNETTKREKFAIEPDEFFEFGGIAETSFMTSRELSSMAADLFRSVFSDFEGVTFDVSPSPNGNGGKEAYLSIIFNHNENEVEGKVKGCKPNGVESSGSSVLDRVRARDNRLREGDRYILTDDAKDVVKSLLVPRAFNNGNVNWKNITTEIADQGPSSLYYRPDSPKYTKVFYIDLNRLCGLLFGSKDGDDDLVYDVRLAAAVPSFGGIPGNNYILNIIKVSEKNIKEFCSKIGLEGYTGSLDIIR